MKSLLKSIAVAGVLFGAGLSLTACGANQPGGKAAAFTVTDLTNAIAIDKANGANGAEKLACDQFLLTQITTIQAAAANAPPVTGLFSAGSVLDGAAGSVLTSFSPAQQTAFEVACGPLALHISGTITGFKALLAGAPGVAAAVGIKP